MRLMIYEGTPEEISQVAASLKPLSPVSDIPPAAAAALPAAEPSARKERTYVSVEIARLVLSRRQLSPEQHQVLKAIYDADPERVPAPKLQALVSYTPAQFAGLMGAFGRRLSHTPGYDDVAWFFDTVWDYENSHYLYRLPDTVREALRLEKLV